MTMKLCYVGQGSLMGSFIDGFQVPRTVLGPPSGSSINSCGICEISSGPEETCKMHDNFEHNLP